MAFNFGCDSIFITTFFPHSVFLSNYWVCHTYWMCPCLKCLKKCLKFDLGSLGLIFNLLLFCFYSFIFHKGLNICRNMYAYHHKQELLIMSLTFIFIKISVFYHLSHTHTHTEAQARSTHTHSHTHYSNTHMN